MKKYKECIECKAKHAEEFCSKCNGNFYQTLVTHVCSSCNGSIEGACRKILQFGEFCMIDGAQLRFFPMDGAE